MGDIRVLKYVVLKPISELTVLNHGFPKIVSRTYMGCKCSSKLE